MTAGPVRLLAVMAALAAAGLPAAGAQELPAAPLRLAQAGPLVLPGAMPTQPAAPPPMAEPAEPDSAPATPPASRGAAPRTRAGAAPAAKAAPRRTGPRAQPAAGAEPQNPAPSPTPAPEALPGFEHLAPPSPPPAQPAPAAADPARARGKAGRKGTVPPPDPATPPAEEAVPLADDHPVPAVSAPAVVLPSAVTGSFQPMVLSDVALLTRRRLLLADAPPLAAAASSGRSVRTASAASVAPLYAPMTFVPGTERVYDPRLAASDSIEALPLALNSVEALREGIPVGPFRAGLIEDNPGGSPRIETGTVVWQVDGDPAVTAERGPAAIRATASIGRGPARVVLTMRNEPVADGSGPLSMELQVEIPGDAVVQAGVPEMRNSGIDRGVALYATVAGDASRVRFAFADNASDGEQNVRMLSQRSWIDLPVRLRSGRKVVFALEKGTAVRDMMREAFRLWRLPWLP